MIRVAYLVRGRRDRLKAVGTREGVVVGKNKERQFKRAAACPLISNKQGGGVRGRT